MLFPFGPHRLYPSFVASVSLLLISMLVPKAGGAKGPALRLPRPAESKRRVSTKGQSKVRSLCASFRNQTTGKISRDECQIDPRA